MDFVLPTLKYMKRNILPLLLLSAVPAALMLIIADFSKIPGFLLFHAADAKSLADIYPYYSALDTTRIFISLIIWLAVIVSAGITMSYIQRSVRIGKFRLSNPLERLNESLFSVFPTGFMLVALFELMGFLTSIFIMLTARAASGTALVVAATLITAVMYGIYFLICAMFIFVIPCMLEVGYAFSEAVGQTLKQVQRRIFKTGLLLFFIFFLWAFIAQATKTYIPGAWRYVAYGAVYVIGFSFLCSFVVIGYNKINK